MNRPIKKCKQTRARYREKHVGDNNAGIYWRSFQIFVKVITKTCVNLSLKIYNFLLLVSVGNAVNNILFLWHKTLLIADRIPQQRFE